MNRLSHFDERGIARMVDVAEKDITRRIAIAKGVVKLSGRTLELIRTNGIKKGDALAVARLAGITGAKKTPDLIPLCHPLPISGVDLDLRLEENPPSVEIEARVSTVGRTGVEMEALTAVTTAALTVYDMVKSVDRAIEIADIRLVFKEGGKSGLFEGRA